MITLSDSTPTVGDTITATTDDADSYIWYLDNLEISTDAAPEIDTTLLSLGAHVLTLFSVLDDVPSVYSVIFTVVVEQDADDLLLRQIRIGLANALNNPLVTDICSVYYRRAPDGANLPYLIFDNFSSFDVKAFQNTTVCEDFIWVLQAFTDKDSHPTKGKVELAEEMLKVGLQAIGNNLTLASGETWYVDKTRSIRFPNQLLKDSPVHQEGYQLRIVASK